MELEYVLLRTQWSLTKSEISIKKKRKKKKGNDVNTYLVFVFMVAIFTKRMHDIFLFYFSNIRHFLWCVPNCYHPNSTPYT